MGRGGRGCDGERKEGPCPYHHLRYTHWAVHTFQHAQKCFYQLHRFPLDLPILRHHHQMPLWPSLAALQLPIHSLRYLPQEPHLSSKI